METSADLARELHDFALLLNSIFQHINGKLDSKLRENLKNFAKLLAQGTRCIHLGQPLPEELMPNLRLLHASLQDIMQKHNYQVQARKSRFITKPQKLAEVFTDLLTDHNSHSLPLQIMRIRQRWSEIIPDSKLHGVQIIGLTQGKLLLHTPSKEQILLMLMTKPQIIARLNSLFTQPIIQDINFSQP